MDPKRAGQHIASKRSAVGLSTAGLAAVLGWRIEKLSRIEHGARPLSPRDALLLDVVLSLYERAALEAQEWLARLVQAS